MIVYWQIEMNLVISFHGQAAFFMNLYVDLSVKKLFTVKFMESDETFFSSFFDDVFDFCSVFLATLWVPASFVNFFGFSAKSICMDGKSSLPWSLRAEYTNVHWTFFACCMTFSSLLKRRKKINCENQNENYKKFQGFSFVVVIAASFFFNLQYLSFAQFNWNSWKMLQSYCN